MSVPLIRDRIPAAFVPEPGDVASLGARRMLIVQTGRLEHSGGYGPVEMRAVDLLDEPLSAGTMVATPWGMLEIVAVDDARFSAIVASARETRTFRTAEPPPLLGADEDDEGDGDRMS